MKKWMIVFVIVCVLGFTFVVWPAPAANQITLKIATIAPKNTDLLDALDEVDKELRQRTDGRVGLRVYPGGVMGNDADVMRRMRTGQLHGSTFTAGGLRTIDSNYQALTMPMLFRSYEEVDAVRAKFEQRLTQQLEAKGMVSFGMMETGFAYMMSTKPLHTLEDLRGRKIWVPEGDVVGERVFRKLGVPPVYRPISDVLTGLQTGLLDTVTNSPVGTILLQWFTKVDYVVDNPLLYTYGTIGIPTNAWNKIPAADRPVVREVFNRLAKRINQQTRQSNAEARETLKKEGLKFIRINDSELPKMEKLAREAIDDIVAEGKFDGALVNEIRATVQAMR
ncbi:MAG: TRAP transporter substrate-binding protein DctP [Candidatus Lernaella stagnicola]|nr:TRAP transporter substrate-binding protein DctP [Candidatus Lernaella stagnicola]